MVCENYREFEESLFAIAIRSTFRRRPTMSIGYEAMGKVERRLANCLGSLESYRGHATKALKYAPTVSHAARQISDAVQNLEDSIGPYQVMKMLRNATLHSNSVVRGISYDGQAFFQGGEHRLLRRIDILVDPEELLDRGDINKKLRGYLRKRADSESRKVDLRPLVREALSALAKQHNLAMAAVSGYAQRSSERLQTYMERVAEPVSLAPEQITIDAYRPDGEIVERHVYTGATTRRWKELALRNEQAESAVKFVVSNESRDGGWERSSLSEKRS